MKSQAQKQWLMTWFRVLPIPFQDIKILKKGFWRKYSEGLTRSSKEGEGSEVTSTSVWLVILPQPSPNSWNRSIRSPPEEYTPAAKAPALLVSLPTLEKIQKLNSSSWKVVLWSWVIWVFAVSTSSIRWEKIANLFYSKRWNSKRYQWPRQVSSVS